jgi:hypothetical protein
MAALCLPSLRLNTFGYQGYFNLDIIHVYACARTLQPSCLPILIPPGITQNSQHFQSIMQHILILILNTHTLATTHNQTSSSNIPSNSSLPNGTLNLSVPIPSFRDSTI